MSQICQRFFVSGHVQGVFYRDATTCKAEQLSVRGWVRNLSDGRVEVLACGEDKQVHALARWLWEGSDRCRVDSVRVEQVDEPFADDDFYIKY